ncbi:MAG: hypothetical protein JXB33_08335 [Clostridia bacterium]|nr:hypothetical protein [Clostridia bacterium]
MLKHLKNNRGWAMALVVILVAIVPIFVTALYTYSMTSTKLVLKQIELERARYIARSGMEAAVYVWQDASMDAKPSGSMERVYMKSDGTFLRQSQLSAEQIANDTLGYVDVSIVFNNDSLSNEYLTTKITANAIAGDSGQIMSATSLPYQHGDLTNWYNDTSGVFNTSNGEISKSISDPVATNITYFDLEGVVTCDTKDKDGFTFQNGNTGILVDTLFFDDVVDLTAGSDKILFITARKVIFRDKVLLSDGSDYETLILHAVSQNAIDVSGTKYGAVYFKGDVTVDGTTVINAGSNYYYKSRSDGVDIIKWATGGYGTDQDVFIPIPSSGDQNNFTPTEASSIYFIYE